MDKKKSFTEELLVILADHQAETLPEPARKSPPAHYQSAGRDIFGWLALLWVDRDLGTEEEVRILLYVAACINIFMRL